MHPSEKDGLKLAPGGPRAAQPGLSVPRVGCVRDPRSPGLAVHAVTPPCDGPACVVLHASRVALYFGEGWAGWRRLGQPCGRSLCMVVGADPVHASASAGCTLSTYDSKPAAADAARATARARPASRLVRPLALLLSVRRSWLRGWASSHSDGAVARPPRWRPCSSACGGRGMDGKGEAAPTRRVTVRRQLRHRGRGPDGRGRGAAHLIRRLRARASQGLGSHSPCGPCGAWCGGATPRAARRACCCESTAGCVRTVLLH